MARVVLNGHQGMRYGKPPSNLSDEEAQSGSATGFSDGDLEEVPHPRTSKRINNAFDPVTSILDKIDAELSSLTRSQGSSSTATDSTVVRRPNSHTSTENSRLDNGDGLSLSQLGSTHKPTFTPLSSGSQRPGSSDRDTGIGTGASSFRDDSLQHRSLEHGLRDLEPGDSFKDGSHRRPISPELAYLNGHQHMGQSDDDKSQREKQTGSPYEAKQVDDKFKEIMQKRRGGFLSRASADEDTQTIRTEDFVDKFQDTLVYSSDDQNERLRKLEDDLHSDGGSDTDTLQQKLATLTRTPLPTQDGRSSPRPLPRPLVPPRRKLTPTVDSRPRKANGPGVPPVYPKPTPTSTLPRPSTRSPLKFSPGHASDADSVMTEDFENSFRDMMVTGNQTGESDIDGLNDPIHKKVKQLLKATAKYEEKPLLNYPVTASILKSRFRASEDKPKPDFKSKQHVRISPQPPQYQNHDKGEDSDDTLCSDKEDRVISPRSWGGVNRGHLQKPSWGGSFERSLAWPPYKIPGYQHDNYTEDSLSKSSLSLSQSSLSSSEKEKESIHVQKGGRGEHNDITVVEEPAIKLHNENNNSNAFGRNFSRQTSQISSESSDYPDTSHYNSRSTSTSESMFEEIDPLAFQSLQLQCNNKSSFRGYQYNNFTGATRRRSSLENPAVSPYNFKNHNNELTMKNSKQQKKRRDLIVQDEEEEDYPFAKYTFNKKSGSTNIDESSSTLSTSSHRSSSRDSIYSVGMMNQYTHLQSGINRQLLNKSSSSSLFSSMNSTSAEPVGSIDDISCTDNYVSDWKHRNSMLYSQNSNSNLYPKPYVPERSIPSPTAFPYGVYNYPTPVSPISNSNPEQFLSNLGFGEAQSFLPERFLQSWIDKVIINQEEEYMKRMIPPPHPLPVFYNDQYFIDDSDLPPSVSAQQSGRSTPRWKQSFDYSPSIFSPSINTKQKISQRRFLKRSQTMSYNSQSKRSDRINSINEKEPLSEPSYTKASGLPIQNSFERLKKILQSTDPVPYRDRDSRRNMFASNRQKSLPLFLETLSEEDEEKRRSPSFEKVKGKFVISKMMTFLEEEERMSVKTASTENSTDASQSDSSRRSSFTYDPVITDMLQSVKNSLSAIESESDENSLNGSDKVEEVFQKRNIPSIVVSEKSSYNDIGKPDIHGYSSNENINYLDKKNKLDFDVPNKIPSRPYSPSPESHRNTSTRSPSPKKENRSKSPRSPSPRRKQSQELCQLVSETVNKSNSDEPVDSNLNKKSAPFQTVNHHSNIKDEHLTSKDSLEVAEIMDAKNKRITLSLELSTIDSASPREHSKFPLIPKHRRRHSASSRVFSNTLDVEDKYLSPTPSSASPNVMSPITVIEIRKLDNLNDSLEMEEVKALDSSETSCSENQNIKLNHKPMVPVNKKRNSPTSKSDSPLKLSSMQSLPPTPRSLSLERRSYELDGAVSDTLSDTENEEEVWSINKKDCQETEVQVEMQEITPLIKYSEISSMLEKMFSKLPQCSMENLLYLAQDKTVQCNLLTENSVKLCGCGENQEKTIRFQEEIKVENKNKYHSDKGTDFNKNISEQDRKTIPAKDKETNYQMLLDQSMERGEEYVYTKNAVESKERSCQTEDDSDELKHVLNKKYNEFAKKLRYTTYNQETGIREALGLRLFEGNVTPKLTEAHSDQIEAVNKQMDESYDINGGRCKQEDEKNICFVQRDAIDKQNETVNKHTTFGQIGSNVKQSSSKPHHKLEFRVTSQKEIQLKKTHADRNLKMFRSEAFFILQQKSSDDTDTDSIKCIRANPLLGTATATFSSSEGTAESLGKKTDNKLDIKGIKVDSVCLHGEKNSMHVNGLENNVFRSKQNEKVDDIVKESLLFKFDRLDAHRFDYEPCDNSDVGKLGIFCDKSPEINDTFQNKTNYFENQTDIVTDSNLQTKLKSSVIIETKWEDGNIDNENTDDLDIRHTHLACKSEFKYNRKHNDFIKAIEDVIKDDSSLVENTYKNNDEQAMKLDKCHSELIFNFDESPIDQSARGVKCQFADTNEKRNWSRLPASVDKNIAHLKSKQETTCAKSQNIDSKNSCVDAQTQDVTKVDADNTVIEKTDSGDFSMQEQQNFEHQNTEKVSNMDQYSEQGIFVSMVHLDLGSSNEDNQSNSMYNCSNTGITTVKSIIYPSFSSLGHLSRTESSSSSYKREFPERKRSDSETENSLSTFDENVHVNSDCFSSEQNYQFIAEVSSPTDSDCNIASSVDNKDNLGNTLKLVKAKTEESESSDSSRTVFNSTKEIHLSFVSSDASRTLSLRSSYDHDHDHDKENSDHEKKETDSINGSVRLQDENNKEKSVAKEKSFEFDRDLQRYKPLSEKSSSENDSETETTPSTDGNGEISIQKISRSLDFDTIGMRKNILQRCHNTTFSKSFDTGTEIVMEDVLDFDDADTNEDGEASWENKFDWSADFISNTNMSSIIKETLNPVLRTSKNRTSHVSESVNDMIDHENNSEAGKIKNFSEYLENEVDKVQYQIGVNYMENNEHVDVYGRIRVVKTDAKPGDVINCHTAGMNKLAKGSKHDISIVRADTDSSDCVFDMFQQVNEEDSKHHITETKTALDEIEQLYKMSLDDKYVFGEEDITESALKDNELETYGEKLKSEVEYSEFMEELDFEIKQMETYTMKNCEIHICKNCGHTVTLVSKDYSPDPIEHDFCIECSPLNLTAEALEKKRLQNLSIGK